jgi:glycosyltransferase involved in cell wall biosynthesis
MRPRSPNAPLRVLIVHNLLWSHYKAAVFSELHRQARQSGAIELRVVQLAKTERSRLQLGDPAPSEHAYPYDLLFDGPIEEFGAARRFRSLLRAVRRFGPDVVNLTGYYDPAQVGLLAYCKLRGIRTILSTESNAFDHARRGWKERLKSALVRQFDGFFCFGTPSAQYLLALGARSDQILTDRAAVVNDAEIRARYEAAHVHRDSARVERGLARRNFIYVGRLLELKNLQRLLDAFADAQRQTSTEWGLVFLGEGPEKESLQARADALGTTGVRFLPGVPWYEVPATFALGDALVLPSYTETWGLVVNEAMVCGLPVLVSDHCGCVPDLVRNGENGFTFDPFDVPALRGCLLALMNADDAERRRMGEASRRLVRAFSLPDVAAAMLAGFRRVAFST